jgi:hypothetical protein
MGSCIPRLSYVSKREGCCGGQILAVLQKEMAGFLGGFLAQMTQKKCVPLIFFNLLVPFFLGVNDLMVYIFHAFHHCLWENV